MTQEEKLNAMKRIVDGVKVSQELEKKSNVEIAALLREHLLNDMIPLSPRYELVEIACQRLDPNYYND